MAKSPRSSEPASQSLSERERLARDLFVRFLNEGKTPQHAAVVAFEHADVFFTELDSRRNPSSDDVAEAA